MANSPQLKEKAGLNKFQDKRERAGNEDKRNLSDCEKQEGMEEHMLTRTLHSILVCGLALHSNFIL